MSLWSSIRSYFSPPPVTGPMSFHDLMESQQRSSLIDIAPSIDQSVYTLSDDGQGAITAGPLSQRPSLIVCSQNRDERIGVVKDVAGQAMGQGRHVFIASTSSDQYPSSDQYLEYVSAIGQSIQDARDIIADVAQRVLFYSSSQSRIDQRRVLVIPDLEAGLMDDPQTLENIRIILLNGYRFNISVVMGCSDFSQLPLSDVAPRVKGNIVYLTEDAITVHPLGALSE